jgi:predicted DNA-binding protein (UPF0251 family)
MLETVLPDDAVLAQMSQEELNRLANEIGRRRDQAGLEQLSDALIRINDGWKDGAHSETSDTRRNRRIVGREVKVGDNVEVIRTPIPEENIRRVMKRAAEAGLTERQRDVWILIDVIGYRQEAAAEKLGIKQPAVSRLLNRARTALWEHIDRNSVVYRVFLMESHRAAYFKPSYRPPVPRQVEDARCFIEEEPHISTHIQADALKKVEIWYKEDPVIIETETGEQSPLSVSFSRICRYANKKRREKFLEQCNNLAET